MRIQRPSVEQRIEHTPYVQILDAPVPQKVEQLVDFFKDLDSHVPVQVIEVPKISQDIIPQRSVDLVPKMVEQLVEVPTIVSYSSLQRTVEHRVDIPVPGRGWRSSGLQGFLPGQSSRQRRSFPRNAFLSGLWSRSFIFPVKASRFPPRTVFASVFVFSLSSWFR